MSCDQKVIMLLPQWRSALWTSMKELFLLPKFDNSVPSVPRYKEICPSNYEVMMLLTPEAEYPREPSECGLPVVQI